MVKDGWTLMRASLSLARKEVLRVRQLEDLGGLAGELGAGLSEGLALWGVRSGVRPAKELSAIFVYTLNTIQNRTEHLSASFSLSM